MDGGPAVREPPRPKAILATPLNVEESRAQRQQRSQARFRDRGGIFVPSNRNTLADILLGKAEPLKRPSRRSVSASPLGHLSKGHSGTQLKRISSPTKRTTSARNRSRSPLKQSRKSNHGDGAAGAYAEQRQSQSPRKPIASTSTAKPKAKPAAKTSKAKASASTKKTHPAGEGGDETGAAPPKTKPKPRAKSKANTKTIRAEEVHDVTEDDDVSLNIKGKSVHNKIPSKVRASKPTEKPTESSRSGSPPPKPTNPPPEAPIKIASSSACITKPRRSRATSDLYSGASEDEYVPKPSKSKAKPKPKPKARAAAKTVAVKTSTPDKAKEMTKEPRRLSDIMEEDEEEEAAPPTWISSPPQQISAKVSKARTSQAASKAKPSKGRKRPAQDASEDEESPQLFVKPSKAVGSRKQTGLDAKNKCKPKATTSESVKGKKKRSADEDEREVDAPRPPAKRSKVAVDDGTSSKQIQKSKAKSAPQPKGKKCASSDDESVDKPIRPAPKRANATAADEESEADLALIAEPSKSKTTLVKKPATQKRAREDDASASDKRSTKRKKPLSKDEGENVPKKAAKGTTKPPKTTRPSESKSKKPSSKPTKSPSGKATESALKENTSGSANSAVVVRRGPPKSVLERLKARDKPHVVDDDPDPIDFLS